MSYYNTTCLAGDDLKTRHGKTRTQDEVIADLFSVCGAMSPSKACDMAAELGYHWPITSVRRSIHTLTKELRLEKTQRQVSGRYGVPEHVWEVRQ